MLDLSGAMSAWGTAAFDSTFKRVVEQADLHLLPLQEGLSHGSHALFDRVDVVLLHVADTDSTLEVKAGLFYKSVIAGCSCADDPTPVDELTEYCEVIFHVDKGSGAASVTLVE